MDAGSGEAAPPRPTALQRDSENLQRSLCFHNAGPWPVGRSCDVVSGLA